MTPPLSSSLSLALLQTQAVTPEQAAYDKIKNYLQNKQVKWDTFESLQEVFEILESDVDNFENLDHNQKANIYKIVLLSRQFVANDLEAGVLGDDNKERILHRIFNIYSSVKVPDPEPEIESTPPSRFDSPAISEDFERDVKEDSDIFSQSPHVRGKSFPIPIRRASSAVSSTYSSPALSASSMLSSPLSQSPSQAFMLTPSSSPDSRRNSLFSTASKVRILPTDRQERKISDFFRNFLAQYFPVMINASRESCFFLLKDKIGEDFEAVFPEFAQKQLYVQKPTFLEERDKKMIISVMQSIGLFLSHLNSALNSVSQHEKAVVTNENETLIQTLNSIRNDMRTSRALSGDHDSKFAKVIQALNQKTSPETEKVSIEKEEEQIIDEMNKLRNGMGRMSVLTNDLHKGKILLQLRSYIKDLINEMNPEGSSQSKFIQLYVYLGLVDKLFSPFPFCVIIDRILVDGLCFQEAETQTTAPASKKKENDDQFAADFGNEIYKSISELIGLGAPKGITKLLGKSLQFFMYSVSDRIGKKAVDNLKDVLASPTLIRPINILDQLLFRDIGTMRSASLLNFLSMNEDKKRRFQAELEQRIDKKLYDFLLQKLQASDSKTLAWTAAHSSSLKTFCDTLSRRLYRTTQMPRVLDMFLIYVIEGLVGSNPKYQAK